MHWKKLHASEPSGRAIPHCDFLLLRLLPMRMPPYISLESQELESALCLRWLQDSVGGL